MKHSGSLKKTRDFQEVYHTGVSCADRNLVIYYRKNLLEMNRLGISVSRKYGNSVARHLFRRRIRAVYEKREDDLLRGIDLVVIARNHAAESSFSELADSFDRLVRRLKAVVPEQ